MKYPIYIPSKGRATNQKTANLLINNGIHNFFVIVEDNEYTEYAKYMDKKYLLKLPGSNYGTPVVARNFAITHSISEGYKKHWQLDDDIPSIYAHDKGKKIHTDVLHIFEEIENTHIDEVLITGINTSASFLKDVNSKFNLNTSLTSCYLITNSKFRFRPNTLSDLDYILQILKAGYSSLKFNNFAFTFTTPLKQPGGCTEIHRDEKKRLLYLNNLFKAHPEITPGIKRVSNGMLVAANVSKVWRLYKKNNTAKILRKLL